MSYDGKKSTRKNLDPTPAGFIISGDKMEADIRPSLPIFFSMMILAYSRRLMSKMLRAVGGYTDPMNTLLYTDTDSMVIRKKTFEKLKAFKNSRYVGSRLGQLEDEMPNCKIISARFLAPKTYCLGMLKYNKEKDKWFYALKVRCKGIPHRGECICNELMIPTRLFSL